MTEKPILFSAPMVRAILAGAKTQTRRIVKLTPDIAALGGDLSRAWPDLLWTVTPGLHVPCADGTTQRLRNPWGFPEPDGVGLWVKETTWRNGGYVATDPEPHASAGKVPSIFMPRSASRIALKITGVRAERLQDVSDDDARAEGFEISEEIRVRAKHVMLASTTTNPILWYRSMWDVINGAGSWVSNPWVWVVTFERR